MFSFSFYPRTGGRLGNNYLLWGDELKHVYFPFICLVGPDWPTTLVTYAFMFFTLGGDLYLLKCLLRVQVSSRSGTKTWIPFSIGLVVCIVALFFLLLTTCSNPGIIFRGQPPSFKGEKASVCRCASVSKSSVGMCGVERPRYAYHCDRCDTCCESVLHSALRVNCIVGPPLSVDGQVHCQEQYRLFLYCGWVRVRIHCRCRHDHGGNRRYSLGIVVFCLMEGNFPEYSCEFVHH